MPTKKPAKKTIPARPMAAAKKPAATKAPRERTLAVKQKTTGGHGGSSAEGYTTIEACGYIVVVKNGLTPAQRDALISKVCAGAPAKELQADGVIALLH